MPPFSTQPGPGMTSSSCRAIVRRPKPRPTTLSSSSARSLLSLLTVHRRQAQHHLDLVERHQGHVGAGHEEGRADDAVLARGAPHELLRRPAGAGPGTPAREGPGTPRPDRRSASRTASQPAGESANDTRSRWGSYQVTSFVAAVSSSTTHHRVQRRRPRGAAPGPPHLRRSAARSTKRTSPSPSRTVERSASRPPQTRRPPVETPSASHARRMRSGSPAATRPAPPSASVATSFQASHTFAG